MEHPCGPSRNLFRSVEPETVIAHASLSLLLSQKSKHLPKPDFLKKKKINKEILVTRTDLVAKKNWFNDQSITYFWKTS